MFRYLFHKPAWNVGAIFATGPSTLISIFVQFSFMNADVISPVIVVRVRYQCCRYSSRKNSFIITPLEINFWGPVDAPNFPYRPDWWEPKPIMNFLAITNVLLLTCKSGKLEHCTGWTPLVQSVYSAPNASTLSFVLKPRSQVRCDYDKSTRALKMTDMKMTDMKMQDMFQVSE